MNIHFGSFIIFAIGLFSLFLIEPVSGQTTTPPLISIQQDSQQIVVFFQGDLAEIMANSDSYLQKLIDEDEVVYSHTFEIDENHKGLILYVIGSVETAYEISQILSQLNNILMIEVESPTQPYTNINH